MNPDEIKTAHQQLVVLALEILAIFGLAVVADQPAWGGPAVMLLLLLWGMFLIRHSDAIQGLFPENP